MAGNRPKEPLYMPLSPDEQQEAIRRAIDAVRTRMVSEPIGKSVGAAFPQSQEQPEAQQVPNPVLNAIPADQPPPSYGQAPTTSQAIAGALQGDEQKKQIEDALRQARE